MEQLTSIIPSEYLVFIAAAIGIVAAIMPVLPKPEAETGFYAFLYKVLNTVAMNYGNAKNAK
jgi:Mg2+/citrate symporter